TYAALVPATELLLSLNWMVAVLIFNKDRLNKFVELEGLITEAILEEHYDETVSLLDEVDGICGISTWSIAIRGTVLEMADRYSEKQKYLGEIFSKCGENGFFKSICWRMINRYDSNSLSVSGAG